MTERDIDELSVEEDILLPEDDGILSEGVDVVVGEDAGYVETDPVCKFLAEDLDIMIRYGGYTPPRTPATVLYLVKLVELMIRRFLQLSLADRECISFESEQVDELHFNSGIKYTCSSRQEVLLSRLSTNEILLDIDLLQGDRLCGILRRFVDGLVNVACSKAEEQAADTGKPKVPVVGPVGVSAGIEGFVLRLFCYCLSGVADKGD